MTYYEKKQKKIESMWPYLATSLWSLLAIVIIAATLHGCPQSVTAEKQYNAQDMNGEARYRANKALREVRP